jgi:hydrogenase maturation protease
MSAAHDMLLIHGYGNPGRGDDGLGPALIEALERAAAASSDSLPAPTLEASYQLEIEDAAALARHDVVVFVDAAMTGPAPFSFDRVVAQPPLAWSSHRVPPGALLALAAELFGKTVRAYVLGIRGYEFEGFREELSPGARHNLEQALAFVQRAMVEQRFEAYADEYGARNSLPGTGDPGARSNTESNTGSTAGSNAGGHRP